MADNKANETAAQMAREAVARAERQAAAQGRELTDRDCDRLAESTYKRLTGRSS